MSVLLVILIGSVTACGAASSPMPVIPPVATPSGHSSWMLTRAALTQLLRDRATAKVLARSKVYELLRPGQQPLTGVRAESIVTFSSASALEADLHARVLPAGSWGVLYDPEAWRFTPQAEQQDPLKAIAGAAAAVHAAHLRFAVAPALDLFKVLKPSDPAPRWRQFLATRFAAHVAAEADLLEIQAQSLERDTGTYRTFVLRAVQQAHSANARITLLAGLSTNPPGSSVGAEQLQAAIAATERSINGYWLNIPGQGARCPTCGAPRTDLAIRALGGP